MIDLLSKFENVEVDATARISPDDSAFCAEEQTAYERAHKLYTGFRVDLMESIQQENENWAARTNKGISEYRTRVYCQSSGKSGSSDVDDKIKDIQSIFVHGLIEFFSNKYNIAIEHEVIDEKLGLKEPSRRCRSSSEEKRIEEEHRIRSSRLLQFNEIVDEILLQLDGLTFVDKAVQQIKADARNGGHDSYNQKRYFTVVGRIIRFEGFTYLREQHSNVLRGLWHYNTGMTSMTGSHWDRVLNIYSYNSGDDKRVGQSYEFDGRKACKLRYFKTGRWDITFSTEEHANTFAREYLGY